MRLQPLIIAHRGFSSVYPENTLLSFTKAQKLGADGFELDLQLTKDNKVIVFHDETLERTTNGAGKVRAHTQAQLRKLDAGWGQKIPTLDEVLKTFRNGPRLYMELKYHRDRTYRPLIDEFLKVLKRHKLKYSPIVCSFNWPALTYLRSQDSQIAIAVLHIRKPFSQVLKTALKIKAEAISTNIKEVSRKKVFQAQAVGLEVYVWTVNSKTQAALCRQSGVTGIISNSPTEVKYQT